MRYISLPEARVGENVCDHRCVSTGQLLLWQRATETPPTKNTAFLVPSQKTAKSCGRRPALVAPWAKKKIVCLISRSILRDTPRNLSRFPCRYPVFQSRIRTPYFKIFG